MYLRTQIPVIPNEWYHCGDQRLGHFFDTLFFTMLTEGVINATAYIDEYKNYHLYKPRNPISGALIVWPTRKSLGIRNSKKLKNIQKRNLVWNN